MGYEFPYNIYHLERGKEYFDNDEEGSKLVRMNNAGVLEVWHEDRKIWVEYTVFQDTRFREAKPDCGIQKLDEVEPCSVVFLARHINQIIDHLNKREEEEA